jgi:F-type H+-transporting ATPase subunit a
MTAIALAAGALPTGTGTRMLVAEEFQAPGLGLFKWEPLFYIGPLGVTKPMLLAVILSGLLIAIFWAAFRRPQIVPRGIQNAAELGYLFIRDDIARNIIGKKGDKYVPLLFALFFFIWFFNLASVIPIAQFPVTSRFGYPAVLAAIVYVTWVGVGIKAHGLGGFFKAQIPSGLPKAIYPLIIPIEYTSNLIVRPFTHSVRLFANMFAGHLLIALFAITAWHFIVQQPTVLGFGVGIVGVVMTAVMTAFELLIQVLQAFIFTLLAASYIGGALEESH